MSIRKTIIVTAAIVSAVAMVAPTFAGAITISDLMAQIAALQAQLQTLQGGTTVTTGTGLCAGVTFTRNLTVGSTGSDVKCLQQMLSVTPTSGYFGPITLAAVRAYQTAHGLTPANQAGPMTRALLNAALGGTPGTPGTPVVVTGPVAASLAFDNPAAGALVGSQASADLLHINFTGSGLVTSVTLQRTGISDQNTLTNVYLYDGNTRITDGYSFNATGQTVINGLSIAVNGSHVVSVKADVASEAISTASSIAVVLTGYTANGTTTSASVAGNTFMIVTGHPATADLSANTVTGSPNVNAGTSQYTFWSVPIQVNIRTLLMKGMSLKMIGSAPTDALSNVRMFVDGVDTGKVAVVTTANGSSYETFDLASAPLSLTTGSHTIDVRGDIQKGTNRTLELSLQQAADMVLADTQIGVNIAVTGIVPNAGGDVHILQGSVTVTLDPTFTAQTSISSGAANAVIARFTLHAYGEDVKVSSLNVIPSILGGAATGCTTDGTTGAASGACGINNVTLYFNGSQVGSQVNYSAANSYTMGKADAPTYGTAIPFQLGSQIIVPAGQDSTLEIRADLQTSTNFYPYTSGTIKVGLPLETTNGTGQSSQASIAVPAAQVGTGGLSIASANLQVSQNSAYLSQAANPNTTGVKVGSYVIQNQSTSEAVRLTSLTVRTYISSSNPPTAATDITDLSAMRTSDTTGAGSTPIQPTGVDTFSVNDTLQPGASMTVDIFANTGSLSSEYVLTALKVASIGVVDNIANAGSYIPGQLITLGTGLIVNPPTLVISSTTPAEYLVGGSGSTSQATFSFVSSTAATTIQELKFVVSDDAATAGTSVTNVCVGSICAQPVSSTADLTGLSLAVPTGGGLTQNVTVSYSGVGLSGLTPGTLSHISLSYVKWTSGGSTKTLCASGCDYTLSPVISAPGASSYYTMVSSVPTVAVPVTVASGLILGAQNQIGQVTVAASAAGPIKLNQIAFNVGNSGFGTGGSVMAITTSSTTPFIAIGNTAVAGSSCTDGNGTTRITCTFDGGSGYSADFTVAAGSSVTFNLFATITGSANTGSTASVSTSVANSASTSNLKFLWDDTSTNGASGTALTGVSIYNFPTNSYSIHQ